MHLSNLCIVNYVIIFQKKPQCSICSSNKRDANTICIVEMPTDLLMLEETHSYNGLYFILMGRLSPLDGVGTK